MQAVVSAGGSRSERDGQAGGPLLLEELAANLTPEGRKTAVTDYVHPADRERCREIQPVVSALLLHLHNHNGPAATALLEQEGYFDSADEARQFVMAVDDTALLVLDFSAAEATRS